jgi:hypothetical protein
MQVIIRCLNGKNIPLEVNPQDTIEVVKKRITQTEGIPPDQQRLIFGGKQLDNTWTVKQSGIEKDNVIHMVARLLGG